MDTDEDRIMTRQNHLKIMENHFRKLVSAVALTFLCAGVVFGAVPGDAGATAGKSDAKAVHPVVVTNVNGRFLQNGGSCVLASYAVVASYFTGKPITSYF